MNFRELINKLDHINEAEGLTLQSIAAIEKAAMDKATAEKSKGGWTGFTTWDPRIAGNIALAKLAQQNNLEGLFNSEGDFVVAYGNRTWSSNSELHPGENPRVVPPTPDDWKPLAAKGLIPQNAKGPAGLTNWLTSGGAQKEFDAVKQRSADAAANTTGPVDAAQAPKISATDEGAKMTQLEGLVEQYLKLKEDIKNGVKKDQAAKVATDPMDTDNEAGAHAFDPTWGGTKATGGQTVAPNAGATWDNDKQMAVPGVVKETALAAALVESFGYQKKTVLMPFDSNLKEAKDDFDPDEYLNNKYGDPKNTNSGRVDRRTPLEKNVITTIPNAIWNEGTLTWEDEIIPGVYTFADLGFDLGLTAGIVVAGAIMAPFTAGSSAVAGTVIAGGIIVRALIKVARVVQHAVRNMVKPFKGNVRNFFKEIGKIVMTIVDKFWDLVATKFAAKALSWTILVTIAFNGAAELVKAHWPAGYKDITDTRDWVLDKARPAVDWVLKQTGLEEGLQ
jgi:hypothetical protein